jgi:hypothetical protein
LKLLASGIAYTIRSKKGGTSAGFSFAMATQRFNEPIEPMTLGNMRDNGVRSLFVSCWTRVRTGKSNRFDQA